MEAVLINLPGILLAASLAVAPQQAQQGQQGSTAPPVPAAQDGGSAQIELPVSLSKIQKAIARPPAIKTNSDRPVFRVEVFARKPTVEDILGPDYLRGPVAYGGMTHHEFLNMVTPTEYRGYSIFTNREGMVIAATSVALQWALMKAIDKLNDARTERAKEAARKEVLDAMNELEKARAKAGLPPGGRTPNF